MATAAKDKLRELMTSNNHVATFTGNTSMVSTLLKPAKNNGVLILKQMQDFYNIQPEYQEKDDIFSMQYKSEGAGKLKHQCFQEAKELFDKAIRHCGRSASADDTTHATDGCMDNTKLADLFARRSCCFFGAKSYQACLNDIENAFSLEYSTDAYVLHDRAGKCYESLGLYTQAISSFTQARDALKDSSLNESLTAKLTTDLEAKINCMSTTDIANQKDKPPSHSLPAKMANDMSAGVRETSGQFKIQSSDQYGHHIQAKSNIDVGTQVMKCAPYASVLFEDCHKGNCYSCFKKIEASYPCRWCSGILYCSSICEDSAWQEYHQYECMYQEWLGAEWCTKMGHLTLRLAMKTLAPALRVHFPYLISPQFAHVSADGFYDKAEDTLYRDLLLLVRHEESRNFDTNLEMLTICIMLYDILDKSGFVMQTLAANCGVVKIEPKAMTEFVLTHLISMMQIIQCNGFTVAKMRDSNDITHSKPKDMGLGLYLSCSYLNHSCDPDLDLTFHGNTMVLHAVKDIKKGRQIFCDYGFNFYLDEQKKRQEDLKSQYFFDCTCRACAEEWPLWEDMQARPLFKCQNCQATTLDINKAANLSSVKCSQCKSAHDIARVLPQLSESHEVYKACMEQALSGQLNEALPGLLKHLSLQQMLLQQPWREYYGCQAAIKQCFRLRGNTD